MDSVKHRTQISLEDWQYQLLLDQSRKTHKSLSGIIREIITEKFSKKTAANNGADPIFSIIGIGSGDGNTAARAHDELLYATKK